MVLWKRKRPFHSQKGPVGVEKGPFVVKGFLRGQKGKAGLKDPLCQNSQADVWVGPKDMLA